MNLIKLQLAGLGNEPCWVNPAVIGSITESYEDKATEITFVGGGTIEVLGTPEQVMFKLRGVK